MVCSFTAERPLGARLGPSSASWDALGPFWACSGGPAESPNTADMDVRHVRQRLRPLMAPHGPLGPLLGLCWAPHGRLGLCWDALRPSWGCSGAHAASPDTADTDVRNVRQRLRPLMILLGPSWGSVGPSLGLWARHGALIGVLGCVGTLFGHLRTVLGPTQRLRTQPTRMSELSGNACGP